MTGVPLPVGGGTVSLLTVVGGRIVYADSPYAALEEGALGIACVARPAPTRSIG